MLDVVYTLTIAWAGFSVVTTLTILAGEVLVDLDEVFDSQASKREFDILVRELFQHNGRNSPEFYKELNRARLACMVRARRYLWAVKSR